MHDPVYASDSCVWSSVLNELVYRVLEPRISLVGIRTGFLPVVRFVTIKKACSTCPGVRHEWQEGEKLRNLSGRPLRGVNLVNPRPTTTVKPTPNKPAHELSERFLLDFE